MTAPTAEAVARGEEARAATIAAHPGSPLHATVAQGQFRHGVLCACGAHSGWATTRERAEYLHAIHVRVEAGHFAAIERGRR